MAEKTNALIESNIAILVFGLIYSNLSIITFVSTTFCLFDYSQFNAGLAYDKSV
jgi:hypothetical protein